MGFSDNSSIEYLNLLTSGVVESIAQSQRADTERFIKQVFAKAYDADISLFMPVLLCLRDTDNRPHSALGLRAATSQSLFLETYLDSPVEQVLSAAFEQPVDRAGVVEIGNLAVSERGAVRPLFSALTAFLYTAKYQWVVFTIGPMLINTFTRLGLPLTDLGPARPERLTSVEQATWGSYYTQGPRVMGGCIADAYPFLQDLCLQEQALTQLWRQAEAIGRKAA